MVEPAATCHTGQREGRQHSRTGARTSVLVCAAVLLHAALPCVAFGGALAETETATAGATFHEAVVVQEERTAERRSETVVPGAAWWWAVLIGVAVATAGIAANRWLSHRSAAARRGDEERFRRLLENSATVIYQLNHATGAYDYVSPAVERILGYSREEMLERGLAFTHSIMHPDDRERVEACRAEMLAARGVDRPFYEIEYRLRAKDGRYVWFSDVAQLVRDESGVPVATVGSVHDVTERKRLEQQNEHFNAELQRLLELAHELSGELDEAVVLRRAVDGVAETVTRANAASAWRLVDGGAAAVPVAWSGYPDEDFDGLCVPSDAGLVGEVVRSRNPVLVENTAEDAAFERVGRASLDRPRSVIGVPLTSDERVVGALFADNFNAGRPFDRGDLKLVHALAAQTSVALQNARLLERVRHISAELIDAQEAERRRIAHELHDEVGGHLTSLSLSLNIAKQYFLKEGAGEKGIRELGESEALVESLAGQIRGLALQLRPSVLDDLGIAPAIRWFLDRYEKQTEVSVQFHNELETDERFDPHIEITVYRIIQEALNNVARHAGVQSAQVLVNRTDEGLRLHIIDEGCGFRFSGMDSFRGTLGLAGMYERVTNLGGSLEIDSEPGMGTRISATIPIFDPPTS